ncbi:MAG: modulated efflux pump with fused ATPase and integral rane subunit [Candidatus Eremiobacteraeota bacterium]|nr:modulated efflux pump with fused ATPase and integral rane subunit [Candidatus Eremiobacteraeota bacterium]
MPADRLQPITGHLVGEGAGFAGRTIPLDKARLVIGRDAAACDVVLPQPFISKCHAALETDESGRTTVRDLGSKFGTFLNGERITDRSLLDGDRVGLGPDGLLIFRYRVDRAAATQTAPLSSTEMTTPVDRAVVDGTTTLRVERKRELTIGRASDNDIVLKAASVSRHHVKLALDGADGATLFDLGSTNGTYVNGELLREPHRIDRHDLVLIGGFLFKVDGQTIRQIDLSESRICAVGLSKQIKGEPVIDDISLAVLPGEFVGLMGPSGCGKSTLMDALDGLQPAPTGSVFLGDLDLYRNFNAVRRSIGHVPQHDILHDDLTVGRTLVYAARLRLPETATRMNKRIAIAKVLELVNLQHKVSTAFRNLSGGEQKRLSIAIELLTEPNFLFLDEPTSPLDPETTEDLMVRFRKLADMGRTVVMITHKFEMFTLMDSVGFLAKGGRLAFFGPPRAALEYFGCTEPSDIFRRMHQATPEKLAKQFQMSPQYQTYVQRRVRQASALIQAPQTRTAVAATPAKSPFLAQVKQWWTLTQRFCEIKLKDRRNTLLLLLQSPLVAFILVKISGTIGDDGKTVAKTMFISAVIAVWFGGNNAIREIVAELPIYKRERRFSLAIPPYVLSKFAVLSAIGLVQSFLFISILTTFGLLAGSDFQILWATLFLTTLGGISMGLFFSAVVNSTEKAVSILPLILIPQLLLSGFLTPIDNTYVNLHTDKPASAAAYDEYVDRGKPKDTDPIERRDGLGAGRFLTTVVLARWSLDALLNIASLDNEATRDRVAEGVSVPAYASVLNGESESAIAFAYKLHTFEDLAIIFAFSLGLLPLTMWSLKRHDVL